MPSEVNVLSIFCPYAALLVSWRYIYWDNFLEYSGLFLSVAFYLGTTILAVAVARRRKFHLYALTDVSNAPAALWGCALIWIVAFPRFLRNWRLVSSGKAPLRKGISRGNDGIYPTAVLWAGIWMVLLMVEIPSMILSPIMHNESMAVTNLRKYATAQKTFDAAKAAQVHGNTGKDFRYCDNFRNLHYGLDAGGKRLELIPRAMADAFAGSATGAPAPGAAPDTAVPFHGYVFLEDAYVAEKRLWRDDFALIAYPERSRRDTQEMCWINSKGNILWRDFTDELRAPLPPEQSPLHPEGRKLWHD